MRKFIYFLFIALLRFQRSKISNHLQQKPRFSETLDILLKKSTILFVIFIKYLIIYRMKVTMFHQYHQQHHTSSTFFCCDFGDPIWRFSFRETSNILVLFIYSWASIDLLENPITGARFNLRRGKLFLMLRRPSWKYSRAEKKDPRICRCGTRGRGVACKLLNERERREKKKKKKKRNVNLHGGNGWWEVVEKWSVNELLCREEKLEVVDRLGKLKGKMGAETEREEPMLFK